MPNRAYRVILATTEGGLRTAAPVGKGWTILQNTVREFSEATSNDDGSLGDIGELEVHGPGWIALAYKDL
ncbi:MAG TPA: hypothetical protein VMQ62_10605 [Dongiaceae bacterium]|nr:hypothetical protein [Dongiaceae bacterium]